MTAETRRLSASLFNNDKFTEVVLAFDREGGTATAQQLARSVGITHDLVKKVLVRLTDAGFVKALPRIGGSRGVLPYEKQAGPEWEALVRLCALVGGRSEPGRADREP